MSRRWVKYLMECKSAELNIEGNVTMLSQIFSGMLKCSVKYLRECQNVGLYNLWNVECVERSEE